MEKVEITIYEFNELPEEVQQKVLDNNRDWNTDCIDWWHTTYEDYTKELEDVGFVEAKIWFSGFWSQGDGACFDAYCDLSELVHNNLDVKKYRHLLPFIDDGTITASIEKNSYGHHYSHQRTRYIELEYPFWKERCPRAAALCNELKEDLEELRYELSCKIYNALEKDYEYLTSEEAIRDSIVANELKFTEDGKIFHA